MNKRQVGSEKENMALEYMESRGFKLAEMNYRYHKLGEIDIIGYDGNYLVFAEVKYRKTASAGSAAEAVNNYKIKQICKVANSYMMIHQIPFNKPVRFDVVAIDDTSVNWIKNAFDYAL